LAFEQVSGVNDVYFQKQYSIFSAGS